ncbi:uncharacterized protein [Diabrotica undecimpunctata]|uniref:uncharacterized protein n=1 Tax=Diabrotica undecimpunctata TaxID=50387 RepID=UPI003B6336BD
MKHKIVDLYQLLSTKLKEYEIIDEKIGALTAPGEHYGSVIISVDLKVKSTNNGHEEKTINLVAKLLPANEMLRKVFDVLVTFKKEVFAYTVAVPTLVAFQEEYQIPALKCYSNLFPQCFGARLSVTESSDQVDDTGVLIFENLKTQGFYTQDRLKGYDTEAVKIILKDLARFHATPIALKLLKPKVFQDKIKPCLVRNKGLEQVKEIAEVFHMSIIDGAKDCPELEPYLDRIKNVCNRFTDPNFVRPVPSEPWSTISHSDFWTSNSMMLKNSEGKYVQSKILDLQLLTYNSALCDLVFFLFTSVIKEDLEKNFDNFLKIYYDNFMDTLKDFDLDVELFSWDGFKEEFEKAGQNEVYHILVMLKPICTERGIVQNSPQNFVDSDWTRKDLLGPSHRRQIRNTVLAFIERNWI